MPVGDQTYAYPLIWLAVIIFDNGQSCVYSDAQYMASASYVMLNQLTMAKKCTSLLSVMYPVTHYVCSIKLF